MAKTSKNPLPKHVKIDDIAKCINRTSSNIRETYFNANKPQNLQFGEVIEFGTFIKMNGITWDELYLILSAFNAQKEKLRSLF